MNVVEDKSGYVIWLVSAAEDTRNILDTHAGGREIHIQPLLELPPAGFSLYREDPLACPINCRRILRTADLRTLREYFPGSVGVRVLVSGFVIILFEDKKTMQKCWELGTVEAIGGQRPGYLIASYEATSDRIAPGYSIADRPDEFMANQGCLGLRLCLPHGQHAITTTTHCFVQISSNPSPLRMRLAEWYISIRNALGRFRPIPTTTDIPAITETRQKGANTSLGTNVWLAGTNRKVIIKYVSCQKFSLTQYRLEP